MNSLEVIELCKEALWILIKLSAPIMLIALFVGLAISLVQALTQIQEMTLSFVPKIIIIYFAIMLMFPMMITIMTEYIEKLSDRIINIE